jgi:hypothetical protein
MRNFQSDFCLPAMKGLKDSDAARVGKALDCAIIFGILEYLDGNSSLQSAQQLRDVYDSKVRDLALMP